MWKNAPHKNRPAEGHRATRDGRPSDPKARRRPTPSMDDPREFAPRPCSAPAWTLSNTSAKLANRGPRPRCPTRRPAAIALDPSRRSPAPQVGARPPCWPKATPESVGQTEAPVNFTPR